MGTIHSLKNKPALLYYATDHHSIEGQVAVYRLKGEALFVFRKECTSPDLADTAAIIATQRSRYLCPYLGSLQEEQQQLIYDCSCPSKHTAGSTFWGFQNFTLRQEIQLNISQGRMPEEDKVWSLLTAMAEASSILISHRLFIDCLLDNVHLSPLKNYQLYWGDARIGNGHRLYYRTLMGETVDQKECKMSPQELRGLRRGKLLARIDLEKCVMHSLGVLALLFCNSIADYSYIYDDKRQEIRQACLVAMLQQCQLKFGHRLAALLYKMTHESPFERPTFHDLQEEVLSPSQLNTSRASSIAKHFPEPETCLSSKISVRHSNRF